MNQEVKVLFGIIVTCIVILGGAVFLMSGSSGQTLGETVVDTQYLVRENSIVTGNPNATVTVVEFADFQCPACARTEPEFRKVMDEYQDRVKFVFRHYPLQQHKNAVIASAAVEAAGRQNKFWEMSASLYRYQNEWSDSSNPGELFTKYAQELTLDINLFKKDMQRKEILEKIRADMQDGNAVGVRGTPTFFVNGTKVTVMPSYDNLKKLIDGELAK